jgi:CheY-like chemotaxis protein
VGAEGDPEGVVLIVDDDAAIRETLELALQLDHHPTALVSDGKAALDWLGEHRPPCLILLDLMMPGMDGWQVLDQIRNDARLYRTPVVVITAFNRDLGSAAECPVLRKPIELGDLLDVANSYCTSGT